MVDNGETNGSSDASIPNPPQIEHALSITSRKYDVDGDGKLDEAERALRDMDTGNVGHLSNAKVYELMREQIRLQNTNVTQRKLIIGLSCFAVVLALANMGTAFAAARLAQDTTLSGPPEGATGSGTDQRRLSTTGNPVREPWANGMPEDTLLSKRDSGIVGTKQVAATQVTLDLQTRSDEVTPGPDDANLQGAPFACLPLSRVSDMYNRITEGSTASVIANNPNADPALGEMQRSVETLGKAGVSGTKVTFYSPGSTNPSLYIPLGDDICDRPVDRRRTLRTSERRRLARARLVKDMFNRLTHSSPMLRKEAERALQEVGAAVDLEGTVEIDEVSAGDVDLQETLEETDVIDEGSAGDEDLQDAQEETDAIDEGSAGGEDVAIEPTDADDVDADWLLGQLGLEPNNGDTNPLDYLPGDVNRVSLVPVFYFDIFPQDVPVFTGTETTADSF